MTYTYTVTLRPYGDDINAGIVRIDPVARYGYWEHRDGTEGGGLWFQPTGDTLELTDYDGDFELPRRVIKALRDAGYILDHYFDAE